MPPVGSDSISILFTLLLSSGTPIVLNTCFTLNTAEPRRWHAKEMFHVIDIQRCRQTVAKICLKLTRTNRKPASHTLAVHKWHAKIPNQMEENAMNAIIIIIIFFYMKFNDIPICTTLCIQCTELITLH